MRLNTRLTALLEKNLKSFVLEALNHA